MIVRAKRYGGGQEFSDMDMFEVDEDMENMTKALPAMERAIAVRSRHGLAPILELDDDFEDFDASAFVERSYQ
jgi:hypothetical protein